MIWLKLIEDGDYYTVHSNSNVVVETLFEGFSKDLVSEEELLVELIDHLTEANWVKEGDRYILAPYSKPLEFPIEIHRVRNTDSKMRVSIPSPLQSFIVYPKDSDVKPNFSPEEIGYFCLADLKFGSSSDMMESDIRRLILECKSGYYKLVKR